MEVYMKNTIIATTSDTFKKRAVVNSKSNKLIITFMKGKKNSIPNTRNYNYRKVM